MAIRQKVDLIVIGSSTGGPSALIEILPLLPANLPVPILIVQHMPAGFTERLARSLSSRCPFPVDEASSGVPLSPGRVWIAPGNWHMTLVEGPDAPQFYLHQGTRVNSCRPSVDVLFRSSARLVGRGVLGVVLTGMGSDGVEGARDVRQAGGQVLIQDEESCVVWGMPGQVHRAGQADATVALHRIADELQRRVAYGRVQLAPRPVAANPAPASRPLSSNPSSARPEPVKRRRTVIDPMAQTEFRFVRGMVESISGVQLAPETMPLAIMRLTQLSQELGFASPGELVLKLQRTPDADLQRRTVEAVLNAETYFFRDHHPFEALRTQVLPRLIEARRGSRTLQLWSAACSGGQEPYSLAMMIRRHFPELASWRVKILATDISKSSLSRAQSGRYNNSEASRGLSEDLRKRYLWGQSGSWEISPEIRRLVEFRQLNLTRPWHNVPPVDVLLLRNVLLYFDLETRREILSRVRRVLRPDGVLVLGATESTLAVDRAFEAVRVDRSTCFKLRSTAA